MSADLLAKLREISRGLRCSGAALPPRSDRISYLYMLTNILSGKRYIGFSCNPHRRFQHHRASAMRGNGTCSALHSAIRKYGWENFSIAILAVGLSPDIAEMEKRAIVAFGTIGVGGYNISAGGEGLNRWRDNQDSVTRWSINHTIAMRRAFSDPEILERRCIQMRKHNEKMALLGTHKNSKKIRCPKGHEYAGNNLYTRPNGDRKCRECARDGTRRHTRRKMGLPETTPDMGNGLKTHCKRGHPLDGSNLYIAKNGGRSCRICRKGAAHKRNLGLRNCEGDRVFTM